MNRREEAPYLRSAVASLVLTGLGFSFLPLIGTVVGLVFARRARARLRAEPDRWRGEELVHWAFRLAAVGVVLWLIVGITLLVTWRLLGSAPA